MQGNQCVQESYDKDFPSFPFRGLQDSLPFHGIKVQILIVFMRLIKILAFDLRKPFIVSLILVTSLVWSVWMYLCVCVYVCGQQYAHISKSFIHSVVYLCFYESCFPSSTASLHPLSLFKSIYFLQLSL